MENKKKDILDRNFIYYKNANDIDMEELTREINVFFFDTENAPIFPDDIIKKYNLNEVEYNTLEVFKDTSEKGLLYNLLKSKKITTEIYVWQFGCQTSDRVYWGNTIQEFIYFIEQIDLYRVKNLIKVKPFEIFVHNLAWDIEFFKYYFKEKDFKQIRVSQDKKVKQFNKTLERVFDITETDGTTHSALIQLEKNIVEVQGKRKKKEYTYITTLNFRDSAKITPMSLKKISEELIQVEDIYIKNSEKYKYNTVRKPKDYVPTEIEAWYIYCDIYLLKTWYNQFVTKLYIKNDIKPYTISQIAFDSILKQTYSDNVLRQKYRLETDEKELTDRQIYERHFALDFIEKNTMIKEYLRLSYKGGHTTASAKYREIGERDKKVYDIFKRHKETKERKTLLNILRKQFVIKGVSMDITSSYPSQMNLKPLPYGKPIYNTGKYNYQMRIENEEEQDFDFHFITIAFDGFTSKVKNNQFGLNLKLRHLSEKEKKILKTSTNESPTHNIIDGKFVGENKIEVTNSKRKKLIDKYKRRNFIVTLTHFEYEAWCKNFTFYTGFKEGVEFIDYVSFQSEIGHFANGINHFFKIKEENDGKGGNNALKENAKLIINSFYGKHCSRQDREQKFYDFTKDIIRFKEVTPDNENKWIDKKLYAVHYGSAVTAYGRVQLRETCRKIGSHLFIYADTDSLKFDISLKEFKKIIKEKDIYVSFKKPDKKLGAWDYEFSFDDFKAVGAKKYMYKKEGTNEFTCKCAGLPKDVRKQITTKEMFSIGSEFIKKAKKKVVGGNLIIDISYSINDLLRG